MKSLYLNHKSRQARSQGLEKGGGYFERVRKVQTTLTRILIVLKSVSHGLTENSGEISRKARKFEGFFRPKSGGLQKKKKGLRRNWVRFFRRNPKFKGFFPPKNRWSPKKKKQKKKVFFAEIESDFSAKFGNSNVSGGLFSLWGGGLFSIFYKKSASKALKTCDFEYFTSQWGGLEPPRPPPCYATESRYSNYLQNEQETWLKVNWSNHKSLVHTKHNWRSVQMAAQMPDRRLFWKSLASHARHQSLNLVTKIATES